VSYFLLNGSRQSKAEASIAVWTFLQRQLVLFGLFVPLVEVGSHIEMDFPHFFITFFGVENNFEFGLHKFKATVFDLKVLWATSRTILQLISSV
jgi:hypothetical protein